MAVVTALLHDSVRGEQVHSHLNLISSHSANIRAMLAWPRHHLGQIRQNVLAHYGRTSPEPDGPASLVDSGLMRPEGNWTELGKSVSDLLLRESWQEGDEIQQLLHDHLDLLRGSVLDVGCSTGWTLRQIRHASRRAGVDLDEDALALGYRLAEMEGQDVEFLYASAYSLPFEDCSFDCVICRNTLTYMHQEQSLREMARVLKRSGLLFLRYENYRYDIRQLLRFPGFKAWCCHLRDLGCGILHIATGAQHEPGAYLSPGRMFGSTIWIRRLLRSQRCYVMQEIDARGCSRLLGRATQTSLLACKL